MSRGSESLWGLRVLALVVAIVLWFTVSDRRREQALDTTLQVPIRYAVPTGYVLLESVEQVRVGLRGPESRLRQVRPEDLSVLVPLEAPVRDDGSIEVTLRPTEHVRLPDDALQVLNLDPPRLNVRLDVEAVRDVEVEAQFAGTPAGGGRVGQQVVSPPLATVRGPESHVPEGFRVTTVPIDLARRDRDFDASVELVSPDPLVQILRPRVARVHVRIEQASAAAETETAAPSTE